MIVQRQTVSDARYLVQLLRELSTGVRRSQLRSLGRMTAVNTSVTLALTLLIVLLLQSHVDSRLIYWWGGCQVLLMAGLNLFLFRAKNASGRSTSRPERLSIRPAFVWCIIAGLMWGALAAFFPSVPTYMQYLLILSVAGMSAGSTTTLASFPQGAVVFILGCLVPPTVYQFSLPGIEGMAAGFILTIFGVAMVWTTLVIHLYFRRQIRAERQARQLMEAGLHERIANLVNETQTLDEAMRLCLNEVCRYTDWPAGHVLICPPDNPDVLVSSGVAHSDKDDRFKALKEISLNISISRGEGLTGRILETGEPVWVLADGTGENLPVSFEGKLGDNQYIRSQAVAEAGLTAYIGFPIKVGQTVRGVIEFASSQSSRPSQNLMNLLSTVATQLGRAIERDHAQSELRASEAKFRTLIEGSAQGMVVHLDEKFLYVNEAGAQMFGYGEAEFLALSSVFDVVHPDYHEKMKALAAARMSGEKQSSAYDFVGIHKSGQHITLHARADRIDWEGETALLMTAVDISERVRAEAAVRREEKRAKDYLDIAGSIIYASDKEGCFTMLNEAGCRLFERQESEVIGLNAIDTLVPQDNQERAHQQHARWVAGESPPKSFVNRMVTLSGQPVYVRWQLVVMRDENGAFNGILGSGQDITQQREVEEQLRQAQKMQAVGQLTSGIAHDFNNILMVIMGNLELGLDKLSGQGEPAEYLEAALQSAQRGADLNRQLLTFSRQEDVQQKVVDLNQAIDGMSGLLRRALGEEVSLTSELAETPCFARVDPAQLESAILNLALNARDATRQGGGIVIRTSCNPDQEQVALAVRDSGIGMSNAVRKRSVEPFFTTKQTGSGSGLGLSMVFSFAQRADGALEIDSAPGQGTTVTITLPQMPAPEAGEEASPDVPEEGAPGSRLILLVEDQSAVANAIRAHLAAMKFDVLHCETGDQALHLLETQPIELVLSDILLPGEIDGTEIAQQVLTRFPNVRVALMSGNPDVAADKQRIRPEVPFIRKPFTRAELAAVLAGDGVSR